LNDASKFRMERYPNSTKIYNNMPGAKEEETFTFTPNAAFVNVTIAEGGKNVKKLAPAIGNLRPQGKQTFPINNFKGAVNRLGQPYTGAKLSDAELSSINIKPYKIVDGKDNLIVDYKDIKNASGFKMYYEFNGGDLSIPVSNEPNLQFNVGGKDAVATQKEALRQQKELEMKMNSYHKKVKAGTIKNPILYQKLADVAEDRMSNDEFIDFIKTFQFDK